MTLSPTALPNLTDENHERLHHQRAWKPVLDIPAYKKDERSTLYRSLLRYERGRCDICNPKCPACGTRKSQQPVKKQNGGTCDV